MTSDDFMQELIKKGYNVKYDDVVTVLLDPDVEDPEKLKTLIRDEIGWKNSFGIKYTSPPKWMDDSRDNRIISENCSSQPNNQRETEKMPEKRAPKAPDRESIIPSSVKRKGRRVSRKIQEFPENENIPGQMTIFDYFTNDALR